MNKLSGIRTGHYRRCSNAAAQWRGTASYARSIGNSTATNGANWRRGWRAERSTAVGVRSAAPAALESDAALHDAAIRKYGGGGEVARAVPAYESDDAGNFLGSRHASERYRCVQLGELGGVVHGGEIDRCRHRPRAHPDDTDVVFGELDTGGAREHAHTPFGETIGGVAGHRPILVHRGDVDDATAATLLDHLLGGKLRAEEGALQV